eukprot:356823-Chlamydomonas_euryale.AAC.4
MDCWMGCWMGCWMDGGWMNAGQTGTGRNHLDSQDDNPASPCWLGLGSPVCFDGQAGLGRNRFYSLYSGLHFPRPSHSALQPLHQVQRSHKLERCRNVGLVLEQLRVHTKALHIELARAVCALALAAAAVFVGWQRLFCLMPAALQARKAGWRSRGWLGESGSQQSSGAHRCWLLVCGSSFGWTYRFDYWFEFWTCDLQGIRRSLGCASSTICFS